MIAHYCFLVQFKKAHQKDVSYRGCLSDKVKIEGYFIFIKITGPFTVGVKNNGKCDAKLNNDPCNHKVYNVFCIYVAFLWWSILSFFHIKDEIVYWALDDKCYYR